ncbi:hypothetical protein PG995_011515 [Apiospora arundinis]
MDRCSPTSLRIQGPTGQTPHNWPLKSAALIRRTAFHKTPEGRQVVSNKIWNCAILQEYVQECAFVGFDLEGGINRSCPTQVGLVYLPEIPTMPIPQGMLLGPLSSLNNKIGSELWSLNIKSRDCHAPSHTPCPFATLEATMDEAIVERFLANQLLNWKAQSGKKYLILVGFGSEIDLTQLTDNWPAAAGVFDGWLDTKDLARGTGAPKELFGGKFPSLWKMSLDLGIKDIYMGRKHNAGADALMAVALMIAAWDSFVRGEPLNIPPPSQKTDERLQRQHANRLMRKDLSKA